MSKFLSLKAAFAVGALALAGALTPTSAALAEGAWCADQGGRYSYTNCGYYTYRQCLEAVRGVGGFCRPNTYVEHYVVDDENGRRIHRRVYR
jgi:hypothetical protein